MIRYYLVPQAVTVTGRRYPKYFNTGGATGVLFPNAIFDSEHYGESLLVILASDMSNADDALLAAQPDVTKFADDLDTQLGANLATMQSALELMNLPANLLTAVTPYRKVIRGILGIFAIAQCMAGKGRNIFAGGVTLATTMSQIAAGPRTDLDACMRSVNGGVYTPIADAATGATTVRSILSQIANTTDSGTLLDLPV